MTNFYINDKLVATINTMEPHGYLREILMEALMDGKDVKIERM